LIPLTGRCQRFSTRGARIDLNGRRSRPRDPRVLPRSDQRGGISLRRKAQRLRQPVPSVIGCAASEGDSVRGSPFDEPTRLRFTSLRPPPAASPPENLVPTPLGAGTKPLMAISIRNTNERRATPMGGPAQRVAEAEPSVLRIPILQQTGLTDEEG
jgi:hypothetical protein